MLSLVGAVRGAIEFVGVYFGFWFLGWFCVLSK